MAVMAQRLVRVVCAKCRESYEAEPSEMEHHEISDEQAAEATLMRGRGCKSCQQTGYRGRKAVFELMIMNAALREMTFRSEATQVIRRQARLSGMKTLVDDAKTKALQGITTFEEVERLSNSSEV
jgi:type IV pilus assembly protein PilB